MDFSDGFGIAGQVGFDGNAAEPVEGRPELGGKGRRPCFSFGTPRCAGSGHVIAHHGPPLFKNGFLCGTLRKNEEVNEADF
jgi:hypothetical protein